MLARNMVPIDISTSPKVDPELKEKIWSDVEVIYYARNRVPVEIFCFGLDLVC